MHDSSPPINPYAPPTSVTQEEPRREGYVWREGDQLVIRVGASLPPYCMVTGEPAPYSHPISQIWQPKWFYFLLLLAVIPYFVVSSFMHRRIEMNVPFSRTVYRKHQRWVNVGIVLMVTGGLMVVGFVVIAMGQWLSWPVALLLVAGVLLSLLGMQIASRPPMRLDIIKVEDELIFVDKVHPEYLSHLPDVLNPTATQVSGWVV